MGRMEIAKIVKEEITKTKYSIKCPFCDEPISGTSPLHLRKNLDMHLSSKHGNKKLEIEE